MIHQGIPMQKTYGPTTKTQSASYISSLVSPLKFFMVLAACFSVLVKKKRLRSLGGPMDGSYSRF
jgi:hypothetical protein